MFLFLYVSLNLQLLRFTYETISTFALAFDLNSFFHSTSKHAASSSQVILIIELKIVAITSIYTARLLQILEIGVISNVDVFLMSFKRLSTFNAKFLIIE